MPDLVKSFRLQIPEQVLSIFIEATGDDHAVPGNLAGMQELPAIVEQGVLYQVGHIVQGLIS